jgi:hypothetical protein
VETRRQGTTLFTFLCSLVGTLVVLQLWLTAASLDALLGGDVDVLIPAAAVSLVLFLANGGLLWYVLAFDARVRRVQP